MDEEELEAIRRKRLQQKYEELQAAQHAEAQKKLVLKQLCDEKAFERLMNVKLASPELYDKVVSVLVYLVQAGQLKGSVSEGQVVSLLSRLSSKRETRIEIKRKGGS